jgi:ABC-type phosphate transport system permease subunit
MVNALLILGLALFIGSFMLNINQQGMQKRAIRIEDLERRKRPRR